jgi:hypothetical protein
LEGRKMSRRSGGNELALLITVSADEFDALQNWDRRLGSPCPVVPIIPLIRTLIRTGAIKEGGSGRGK